MKKERFQDLVENTPDLIQVVNEKGKFLYVNKSWIKTLGYTKKQALNMSFQDIIKKDLLSHCLMIFAQLKKGKSFQRIETIFLTEKGKEIFVEGTLSPKIVNGKFIETQGIFRDITKQKKAEEKYKNLYESSQDAIMILEPPNFNFTSGNPKTIELFECKDEKEFISFTPGDLSPKKQPDGQLSSDKAKKMIMKAMKEGSNFFEWTHKTAKGREIPCTVLLTRFNKEGEPVLQATVRNITKEKEFEKKIILEKGKAEKYFDLAGTMILALDLKGEIELINKRGLEILEYKKEEIIGKNWFDTCIPKDIREEVKDVFKKNISGEVKSVESHENKIITKNKNIKIIRWHNKENKDSKGKTIGTISSGEDITKEKKSQEEEERLNRFAIDRELKMIELKKEINSLLKELKKPPKYNVLKK